MKKGARENIIFIKVEFFAPNLIPYLLKYLKYNCLMGLFTLANKKMELDKDQEKQLTLTAVFMTVNGEAIKKTATENFSILTELSIMANGRKI